MCECKIRGCRNVQTICIDCGRLICEKILPKGPEWIRVENEMPEEGQTVMCYNGMVCTGFYQSEYYPQERSKKGWNLDISEEESTTFSPERYNITHWMPLPEPPI